MAPGGAGMERRSILFLPQNYTDSIEKNIQIILAVSSFPAAEPV